MAVSRRLRSPMAAALALLVASSVAPTVYCLRELSGLGGHIARSTQAEAQAKQARRVVDQSGQGITSFAAIALDLTKEERGKVLRETDEHLEQLQRLFPPLEPLAREVLSADEHTELQAAVSSLVHNWGEIREQAEAGMAEAERTFHFLRVFDDTLLIRSMLTRIEEAATRTAQEARARSLESLEAAGLSFALVVSCGGALGLLASLCIWLSSRSTKRANEELTRANAGLQQRDARLVRQNARFEAALGSMCQGLCLFDTENRLVVSNGRFAELLGLPEGAVRPGMPFREVLDLAAAHGGLDAGGAAGLHDATLALAGTGRHEASVWELGGGRGLAVNIGPVDGQGWLITHEDITQRRAAEARIEHMAHHDALTGLPNRVSFQKELCAALGRVRRGGELAVLCLDLDRFKAVNDTLGHPVGDALLRAVAARIRDCVRGTDAAARLGGDEFAVVQSGAGQPGEAIALSRRLVESLSAPYEVEGHRVVIGTSVGIAMAPRDGADADHLLKCADMALYRAKSDGRGTYRFFEPGMDAEMQLRRALELDLRGAAARGEFELHYQPVVDARTGSVGGFEALLRWRHPTRGLVLPAEFVPLAEEVGLIGQIGAWALRTACAEATRWPGGVRVAVNVSPLQFKHRTVVRDVRAALDASGLAPGRLELEITETAMLQDTEATLAALRELRGLGVHVSMDDFGTGYSSLSYLRRFPFDKIKVDRSFVRDIAHREDAALIVRAVVGLGRSLGMSTTVEGVETLDQLERLRREGCSEVQGYYFSGARPADEVADLLASMQPGGGGEAAPDALQALEPV